ncbi:MAG: hypothetical protein LBB63_01285 [Holosporaceae bacterium]|jgi:hypothetical protein|nr:hypothetical protein [Holosporaceae bacterium]
MNKIIAIFGGLACFYTVGAAPMICNVIIKNDLKCDIRILPGDESEFKLMGDVVSERQKNAKFPTLEINGKDTIAGGSCEYVVITVGDVDFNSIGVSMDPFLVQRVKVVANDNDKTLIGYLSFRCSSESPYPSLSFDSSPGYTICTNESKYGGASINVVVQEEKTDEP